MDGHYLSLWIPSGWALLVPNEILSAELGLFHYIPTPSSVRLGFQIRIKTQPDATVGPPSGGRAVTQDKSFADSLARGYASELAITTFLANAEGNKFQHGGAGGNGGNGKQQTTLLHFVTFAILCAYVCSSFYSCLLDLIFFFQCVCIYACVW